MCSGTGLSITTRSAGSLHTLVALTVYTTSLPGTTFSAGTSLVVCLPCSSVTGCSISATVLSRMQPLSCASACACTRIPAATASALPHPAFIVVMSRTPNSIDRYCERQRLRAGCLSEIAEAHPHGGCACALELAGIGIRGVAERRSVESHCSRDIGRVRRNRVADFKCARRAGPRHGQHDLVEDARARNRAVAAEGIRDRCALEERDLNVTDDVFAGRIGLPAVRANDRIGAAAALAGEQRARSAGSGRGTWCEAHAAARAV